MKSTRTSHEGKDRLQVASGEESSSSSSSSWDDEDNEDHIQQQQQQQQTTNLTSPAHFSFDQRNRRESVASEDDPIIPGGSRSSHPESTASAETAAENPESHTAAIPPTDQERQLLLLMLLAQVCALHDPTPRTFTVHVLELFERGMLDRDSIHFLFELGLVPPASPAPPPLLPPSTTVPQHHGAAAATRSLVVPALQHHHQQTHLNHRSREASDIRMKLELLEQQQHYQQYQTQQRQQQQQRVGSSNNKNKPTPPPTHLRPWSVDAHPLSLSRYQREFIQVQLLAAGAFGQVFQATSKMDGLDYAIKRVAFSAVGYSKDSVQQVVREVHCLAVCDHPNVVRYYTSWLEPSWMTGSGSSSSTNSTNRRTKTADQMKKHQKLLMGIQKLVSGDSENDSLSDDLRDYFKDPSFSSSSSSVETNGNHERRFYESEYSEWTVQGTSGNGGGGEYSMDDSYLDASRRQHYHPPPKNPASLLRLNTWQSEWEKDQALPPPRRSHSVEEQRKYSYQICLFIQMQLCQPKTLADWIRERNQTRSDESIASRLGTAAQVFEQIANGLVHVHSKGIVHRDLKPANCFVDGSTFKIGDFGLSKLIEFASHADLFDVKRNTSAASRKGQQPLLLESWPSLKNSTAFSSFPLTAEASSSLPKELSPAAAAKERAWKEPLTAGIGTASYAAPEQVSSRTYGTEADIFSLGLILLELLCCFSTEHERLQTFQDCRNRCVIPHELHRYPAVTRTILACTEHDPRKRPTAACLVGIDLLQTDPCQSHEDKDKRPPPVVSNSMDTDRIQSLEASLAAKDKALKLCHHELADKDRIIEDLQRRLHQLSLAGDGENAASSTVFASAVGLSGTEEDSSEPASSSSEDEL